MKTLPLLLLAAIALALSSSKIQAKTITVTNQANTPADYYVATGQPYATLDALLQSPDVAAGDEVQLLPGPDTYGTVTINKSITLLGNGHYNHPETGRARLSTIYAYASNITILGLEANYLHVNQDNGGALTGFTLRKCHLTQGLTLRHNVQGAAIEGNLFSGYIDVGGSITLHQIDVVFANNVMTNNKSLEVRQVSYTANHKVLFINNTFIGENYQNHSVQGSVYDAFFVRNVFAGWQFNAFTEGNTFYHNVISAAGTLPTGNTGDGTDNLLGVALTFENNNGNRTYDYGQEDLRLTSSPYPGETVGITDTYEPYGTPANPQINNLNVANPVVNQADPLIITINGN